MGFDNGGFRILMRARAGIVYGIYNLSLQVIFSSVVNSFELLACPIPKRGLLEA